MMAEIGRRRPPLLGRIGHLEASVVIEGVEADKLTGGTPTSCSSSDKNL
jgi:hypothetical protein